MKVGGVPPTVALATRPAAQRRGLGARERLAPGTGMLFVGESARPRTLWMKGKRFRLDIVWIGGRRLVGAAEGVCPDPPGTRDEAPARSRAPRPVRSVLETWAGWLAANDLGVGSPGTLPNAAS